MHTTVTNLLRYGCENPQQNAEIHQRTKETNLARYGFTNPSKSPIIIEKIADTHEKKYGVRNIFQRKDIMLDSYEKAFGKGIINPMQVKEINQKAFETKKNRYVLSGAVPKEASEKTCIQKYGYKTFFGSNIGKMSIANLKETYGYSDEDIEIWRKRKDSCSWNFYLKKYATVEEAKVEYELRLKQCDSSSYDWALRKANYDTSVADTIFLERQKSQQHKFGKGSKLSLKVFNKVEEYIVVNCGIDRNDIYVGDEDRKEFFLYDTEWRRIYFYDFTIRSKKIIVEFNGCYYHPKCREENPIAWDAEVRKLEWARTNGFKVFVVWDDVKISTNQQLLIKELSECLAM